jgi:SPP1 gp7 family putative phage head morphogenesis protein
VAAKIQVGKKAKARAARRAEKLRFQSAPGAERQYMKALTSVGKQVGRIVDYYMRTGNLGELETSLVRYAGVIEPWAERVTRKMHEEINWRNMRSWKGLADQLGRGMTLELLSAPVRPACRRLLDEQVILVKSLPLEAAQRVQRLSHGVESAQDYKDMMEDVYSSGRIITNRAKMIARTETARTSSVLTQVRAEHIGSDGYIWHTQRDEKVRPDHRRLEGSVHRWDRPPDAGAGLRYHPGMGPNCRCFPEPILNE